MMVGHKTKRQQSVMVGHKTKRQQSAMVGRKKPKNDLHPTSKHLHRGDAVREGDCDQDSNPHSLKLVDQTTHFDFFTLVV